MKTIFLFIGLLLTVNVFSQPNNVIAKTLYAEARSEGIIGIRAVATVIYNRGSGNYQKSINACLQKRQFSCWNGKTDIAVPKNVAPFNEHAAWTNQEAWNYCLHIEKMIKTKQFIPMDNWNHYAANNVKVSWFGKMSNRKTIKNHTFGFL